jgi:hypothetical protein
MRRRSLLYEDIDTGWKRSGESSLTQRNGLSVLLAAKYELGLALALDRGLPDRKGRTEHDAHDAQSDEQAAIA